MAKLNLNFDLFALTFATLASVAAAALIQYGFCYENNDCTSANAITVQGPDTQKEVNLLNGYYKYCASFKGEPSIRANIYACESGCNTNCTKAEGSCTKPQIAPRFSCVFRTGRVE